MKPDRQQGSPDASHVSEANSTSSRESSDSSGPSTPGGNDRATKRRDAIVSQPPGRTIFLLALPVLTQQLLNFCVGFFDTYLSGQLSQNSAEATSAVGMAAYVGWLISMLVGLVSIGTGALVARHWGAGEFREANRISTCSLTLSVIAGLFLSVILFFLAPVFAELLGMTETARRTAVRYLQLDALGHPFLSVTLVGAAALRGAGDMRTPMIILGLENLLNIAVSVLFVYGVPGWVPQLGVDGIVTGTLTARIVGGVIIVVALRRGISGLQIHTEDVRPERERVRRILKIGVPAALDGGIMWSAQFLFLMIVARLDSGGFGSATFAAHMVGIEVEAITYLPAVAWGSAAATMIGQSLGAGKPERARRGGHIATLQCSVLAIILTAVFATQAEPIFVLMHNDKAVHAAGVPAFRLLAWFQVPLAAVLVYMAALRGAGETRGPLVINAVGIIGIRLTVAWICGIVWSGGLRGAWIGMCAGITFRSVLALLWYVRGHWDKRDL